MEYIKKEDLKDGDVFVTQLTYTHFLNKYGTGFSLNLKTDNTIRSERLYKNGGFAYDNMRLATPEEKHWLETCITADKFITFEEAMETFIPQYVECIRGYGHAIINKVYNTNDEIAAKKMFGLSWSQVLILCANINKNFKPSTKEAYDAQFVVKEPEFVLPEKWCVKHSDKTLEWIRKNAKYNGDCITPHTYYNYPETTHGCNNYSNIVLDGYTEITFEQFKKYILKEETVENQFISFDSCVKVIEQPITESKTELENWLENTKSLNLSLEDLGFYIGSNSTCNFSTIYSKLEGTISRDKAEILFDKWNKEVVEPLPQFKVIESIETITKVENNEGNQFFIGDVVVTSNGTVQTIESFAYNQDKTELHTNFEETLDVVNINKLEHYIEPKAIEPEFTLPEKWCIATKNMDREIRKWFLTKNLHFQFGHYYYGNCPFNNRNDINDYGGLGVTINLDLVGNIEITAEQFKKHILKEESKAEVKDEFILPEKWFIKTTQETFDIIRNWALEKLNYPGYKIYQHYSYVNFNYLGQYRKIQDCTEITFDQFWKYVLKEEPKVEVENKTAINIAKNSFYGAYPLTPEECDQSQESLLKKAKRLYPVGTKVNNYNLGKGCIFTTNSETFYENYEKNILVECTGIGNYSVYCNGKWAEVIEYPHGFEIGDMINIKTHHHSYVYKIESIEGNVLFFNNYNSNLPKNHNRVLAKNAVKIN